VHRPDPRRRGALLAALLLVADCACGGPSRDTSHDACPAEAPAIASDAAAHALKTVFVIVLENRDWASIEGSPSAPYINGALLPAFAHASNYRNGGLHPSLGNYIALVAGDPLGITANAPPIVWLLPVTCHLATYLEKTGVTWKAYAEGIPAGSCPVVDVDGYAVHHNPFVYFEDVAGSAHARSSRCIAHVRPHAELGQDLRSGAVARYNFIIPSLCNSGHDSCAPQHHGIRQADDFLAREVPLIMASAAYQDGGVILITWDEGVAGDEPIGLIAVSPFAKPGYRSDVAYAHASTLRTVSEIFGLTPLLRGAATATSLSDLFTTYP
jgi:phosphatidylinositol-3-phosphatase